MQACFNELVGATVSTGSTSMLPGAERADLSRELSSLTPDLEISSSGAMEAQANDTAMTGSACQSMFGTCKVEFDDASHASGSNVFPYCISDEVHAASQASGSGWYPACIH